MLNSTSLGFVWPERTIRTHSAITSPTARAPLSTRFASLDWLNTALALLDQRDPVPVNWSKKAIAAVTRAWILLLASRFTALQ